MTRNRNPMPLTLDLAAKRFRDALDFELRKGVKKQRTLRYEVSIDELNQIQGVYFVPQQPEKVRLA